MGEAAGWQGCGTNTYVHLGGWGESVAGRSLEGRGKSEGQGGTPSLPSSQPLWSTPSPQDPPCASWWPRQWGAVGGCSGLGEVAVGFLQAQTGCELQL